MVKASLADSWRKLVQPKAFKLSVSLFNAKIIQLEIFSSGVIVKSPRPHGT